MPDSIGLNSSCPPRFEVGQGGITVSTGEGPKESRQITQKPGLQPLSYGRSERGIGPNLPESPQMPATMLREQRLNCAKVFINPKIS